jgi:predicted Rossmann fold flavoprotein
MRRQARQAERRDTPPSYDAARIGVKVDPGFAAPRRRELRKSCAGRMHPGHADRKRPVTAAPREEHRDIAIIGAGAAGLATAIFAAEGYVNGGRPVSIALLEGAPRIGTKILVSGGARCNVTHHCVTPQDYHGRRNVVKNVLRAFDSDAAVRWFESLGVELKREDTGKLFPVTDSARSVVDALVGRARELGVEIRTRQRVTGIATGNGNGEGAPRFRIEHTAGVSSCDRLVLATGGRSLPRSGSDGTGYELARALGHSVTDTWPSLVPLQLEDAFSHATLSGVAHPARLTVRVAGKRVAKATGDLLWTHFGISGPVAMDISRSWVRPQEEGLAPTLEVSFLPDLSREALEATFLEAARRHPQRSAERWLATRLPRRVAQWVCTLAGVEPEVSLAQVPRAARRSLLRTLSQLELPVAGTRGWDAAEVTAGGVPLAEIDYRSFASRRSQGLWLVGEILDCDGRIGGFNFQWAWASGYIAGSALSRPDA